MVSKKCIKRENGIKFNTMYRFSLVKKKKRWNKKYLKNMLMLQQNDYTIKFIMSIEHLNPYSPESNMLRHGLHVSGIKQLLKKLFLLL